MSMLDIVTDVGAKLRHRWVLMQVQSYTNMKIFFFLDKSSYIVQIG